MSSPPSLNLKENLSFPRYRFGIIFTQWNIDIVEELLKQVEHTLEKHKAQFQVLSVPGSLELVYASKKMALTGKYDGIIILGVVIRGDTYHFEYVCQGVAQGISALNAELNLQPPIIQGLLTVNTKEQADQRIATNKGIEIAYSALQMAKMKIT